MTFEEHGMQALQKFVEVDVKGGVDYDEKSLKELGEALCYLADARGWSRSGDPLLALIAGWREGERRL